MVALVILVNKSRDVRYIDNYPWSLIAVSLARQRLYEGDTGRWWVFRPKNKKHLYLNSKSVGISLSTYITTSNVH